MAKREPEIRVGVSACLLGERVRWDGGHRRDAFLTDVLGPFVTWVAVCPEVEIGLGTPREPIHLAGHGAGAPRLVAPASGADLTRRMARFAQARARELAALGLDGYVLKRASPSCGLFDVPVHGDGGASPPPGRGVYAAALARRLPWLPMEEEGRLADERLRAHFLERIFTAARWRAFVAGTPRPRDLAAFHAAHAPVARAHSPAHAARLDRLAARALTPARLAAYGRLLMRAVSVRAPGAVLPPPAAAGAGQPCAATVENDYRVMAGMVGRD